MYISYDQHEKLANNLMDTSLKLKKQGKRGIKTYELAFQKVIEDVFVGNHWYDITSCDIYAHLVKHKNTTETIRAILKGLKEDM